MLVITGEKHMTLNKRYNRSLVFGLEMMAVLSLVSYFQGPIGWQGFAMFALINVVLLAVISLVNNWSRVTGWFRKHEQTPPVTNPTCL
jgi:hypothetical protein